MRVSASPLIIAVAIIIAVVIAVRPGGSRVPSPASDVDAGHALPDTSALTPVDSDATRGEAPRAEFMYLFDVSTSTHPGGPVDPFLTSTQILIPAIDALRSERVEHLFVPGRHRVGTIGAASLMQKPLCDFRVEPTMLFRSSDTSVINRRLAACEAALRASVPENATDIRGALHYAGLTLRSDRPAVRGIVLVTDLEEFIPKDRVAAQPNLQGVCVNVYTVMTPGGASRPDSLALREAEWRLRLDEWGARRVRVRSLLGFDQDDLAGFFRTCAR